MCVGVELYVCVSVREVCCPAEKDPIYSDVESHTGAYKPNHTEHAIFYSLRPSTYLSNIFLSSSCTIALVRPTNRFYPIALCVYNK